MAVKFTESFKIQAVEKALSRAKDDSLLSCATSLGTSVSTLRRWILQSKNQELSTPSSFEAYAMNKEKRPQEWSLEERLNRVITCGSLAKEAINALCRQKGLYPHHVEQWKSDFITSDTKKTNGKKELNIKSLKSENNALKKELNRKNNALAETAALLVSTPKKSQPIVGKRRGRLTMIQEREEMIRLIDNARFEGARQSKACEIIGISAKTLQRWKSNQLQGDGRLDAQHDPKNKLSEIERQRVISTCNKPEYADLSASKIVPSLADSGTYIASESTIYRILKEENQIQHRLKSKPCRKINKPEALIATGPNQIYSWDITYLPTLIRGLFFYLYWVIDIFSRKIVGWQVYEQENSALAADLMTDICSREGVKRHQVTLHSDNGSPMKGATMLATLQELGVMPSFSRPSVSNDNPYPESLFRTLKYRPEYPEKAFEGLGAAREWVERFVDWYNCKHLHSAIKFVTPAQRHAGQDKAILIERKAVYLIAKGKKPERWSQDIRNWDFVSEVHLNPGKSKEKKEECQVA